MPEIESSPWQLRDWRARLSAPGIAAEIDLASPAEGLAQLCAGHGELFDWRLLAVRLPTIAATADRPVDAYVRQGDLVATYDESPANLYRTQIYWRMPGGLGSGATAACDAVVIELVVSQQTSLLDVHHELQAASIVEATEAWHLRSLQRGQFDRLVIDAPERRAFTREHGPGCWLFRPQDANISYGEMVHPADYHESSLVVIGDAAGRPGVRRLELAHRLFESWFEKGVILRSRVLGVFLPRKDDTQQLVAAYRAFAESQPPLTT